VDVEFLAASTAVAWVCANVSIEAGSFGFNDIAEVSSDVLGATALGTDAFT